MDRRKDGWTDPILQDPPAKVGDPLRNLKVPLLCRVY